MLRFGDELLGCRALRYINGSRRDACSKYGFRDGDVRMSVESVGIPLESDGNGMSVSLGFE